MLEIAAVVGFQEQKNAVTDADHAEDFEDKVVGFVASQPTFGNQKGLGIVVVLELDRMS